MRTCKICRGVYRGTKCPLCSTLKFKIDLKPKIVKNFDNISLSDEIKWREPDENMYDGSVLKHTALADWEGDI